jgi:hypothetical protein
MVTASKQLIFNAKAQRGKEKKVIFSFLVFQPLASQSLLTPAATAQFSTRH